MRLFEGLSGCDVFSCCACRVRMSTFILHRCRGACVIFDLACSRLWIRRDTRHPIAISELLTTKMTVMGRFWRVADAACDRVAGEDRPLDPVAPVPMVTQAHVDMHISLNG